MISKYVKVVNEVLRSYAILSDKRTFGFYFDYELLIVEDNKSETRYLKEEFDLPKECDISFTEINRTKFYEYLSKWFFVFERYDVRTNDLHSKPNSEEHEQEIDIFLRYLSSVLNVKCVEIINFEPDDPYILGINYNYFLLKGFNTKFILCFSCMD